MAGFIATSAFNRLSQYASGPGNRAYCSAAELAVSYLPIAETIASTHIYTHYAYPRRDGQAE